MIAPPATPASPPSTHKLDERAEKLRADRDKAIRSAYRGGLPMAEIARVLKMSHQRVSQIVRS